MKTLSNRMKAVFTFIFCFGITLFNSCNNDNSPPSCGCEYETQRTIPESANLVGKLFYKNNSNGNNFNNQQYWIVYVEQNCENCVHNLIICNNEILSSIPNIPTLTNINDIIGNINELESAIDVKFSGDLKIVCNPIFAPGDYTYNNIKLASIEPQ
ncbi:hypothetical protein V2647_12880 [Tenacibaculum maritimum]|uniref:hypothetical protein n=1 Tax=Tenacibaculum maritimum TaxID=107401 RepID=UPI0012E59A4B|nr:hypothetical protein [Tenacibaculum maritimum]CAA0209597.1 Probable lipoprotein precursor [Tenacibaculum maritimum]